MPGGVTSWHRHTVRLVGSTPEVEDTDDVGLIVACPRCTTTRCPRRATWPLPSSRPAMPWRLHLPRPPENLPDEGGPGVEDPTGLPGSRPTPRSHASKTSRRAQTRDENSV